MDKKGSFRRRRLTHRCKKNEKQGVLSPSGHLFNKITQKVTLNSLKEDVIASIRNRESLMDRTRQHLVVKNVKDKEKLCSKINEDVKSNHVKRLFRALHNASLCVVEAIIKFDLMSLEYRESTNSEVWNNQTFCWMGQNYLVKMISDLQFICNFEEMMNILRPEKKSLYRNPFLISLDLDEIIGYEPDISCASSELKKARMSRIPWDTNVNRIKHAASRILFEEHKAVYGNINAVHVFPKSTTSGGRSFIDILLPPPPKLDPNELETLIASDDLKFDEALLIACVRLLLKCDIKGIKVQGQNISKSIVYKLARQPAEIIIQELFGYGEESRVVWVEKIILYNIYTMMIRNLFKEELLKSKVCWSLYPLRMWLFHIVSDELKIKGLTCIPEENISNKRNHYDLIANMHITQINSSTSEGKVIRSDSDAIKKVENVKQPTVFETVPVCNSSTNNRSQGIEESPVPLWVTVSIPEGGHKANILEGSLGTSIQNGDIIRIGHPYHSEKYTVAKVEKSYFFIAEAFVHETTTLQNQGEQDRNMTPIKFSSAIDNKEKLQKNESCIKNQISGQLHLRVWKLIQGKDDHRLEWRKQYDNGFLPWFPTDDDGLDAHFRIKLNWNDVEKCCYDTVCDPDFCVHQQRLHYFEKVSLDDIIIETYDTICHSWHPLTPMIDSVKWAKLARTMQFLSNVKNANHKVDMTFLRHSYQRKLDLKRFKSVLLDIALQKYCTSKYDVWEALANMLWSTVVMFPQVCKMIWTKAQVMAIKTEAHRNCAQIRIAARVRMRQQRMRYNNVINAAICISKNIRCLIASRSRKRSIELANYYRFYRLKLASATICQKYWRRYVQICRFMKHQQIEIETKKKSLANEWQKLRDQSFEKSQPLIFREVMNIQSILTITSIFLFEEADTPNGVSVQIKTYVPQTHHTYRIILNENEIRESLEKFVVRKGPVSWNEMLHRDVLIKLRSRLVAKEVRGKPIIIFCKRDIAEKGILITRQVLPFEGKMFLLSIFRSPYDFVMRLYQPTSRKMLRVKIDLEVLTEWLILDDNMKTKEALGALKLCGLAKENYAQDTDTNNHQSNKETISRSNLPALLHQDKQSELILWLIKRIQVSWDESLGRYKVVLQYEADAERLEKIARKFQSLWRAKCAKSKARKQVHLQYEKHRDWVSKTYFYVHTKSGTRQWSKPSLLRDEEDITDPPDEWRKEAYHDPKTGKFQTYYFNPFTGQSSWLSEDEAARMVQRKFRQRQIEIILPPAMAFADVVKVVAMIKDTETKYEQNPEKLTNVVNFALLCHCIRFDTEQAKALYNDAMQKSSHHPVIIRAYGVFTMAMCKPPLIQTFEAACKLFKQADLIDPDLLKFQSARENFFNWAVMINPNNSMALLNYALLHQCILKEYNKAERIYRRALAQDPSNEFVLQNYKIFENQRYPGGYYTGSGVPFAIIKRSHVLEEEKNWGEWKKMIDPLSSNPHFNTFWMNTFKKNSSFEEPDWKEEWQKRIERSRRISVSSKSLWVEYYDETLQAIFLHNRSTGAFVWKQFYDSNE